MRPRHALLLVVMGVVLATTASAAADDDDAALFASGTKALADGRAADAIGAF